ncbi:hypothetical protein Leryth_018138 [Lithospermum erythrorhizon]|nr:hypothetical protein Leryth_018138 [Lithospermum erythrorhizon]
MAAGKKRKAFNYGHNRKLLPNTKVEVRSVEEGSLGSWHSATVISAYNLTRKVRYDSLLVDDGSDYLTDCIKVSTIVDGGNAIVDTLGDYRGRIRPLPPSFDTNQWSLKWLSYGQCVDMHENEAWWEGVIFDHENGSEERMVFFPDSGGERKSHVGSLRITQDWDQISDRWQPRGNWLFLGEIEKYCNLSVSVKQIWYDVQVKVSGDLKEWTSADRDHWKKWVSQVSSDNINTSISGLEETSSASSNSRPQLEDTVQFSGVSCKRNCEGFPTKLAKRKWFPVPTDMLPESEVNIDAVISYCEDSSKVNRSLIPKVKGHMLSLGWKFEFTKYIFADRLRYISPEGSLYYSLREVCRTLKSKSEVRFTKPRIVGSNSRSPSLPDGFIPSPERKVKKSSFQSSEYNLQAVTDYIDSLKVEGAKPHRHLAVKAKEHLVADGWNLDFVFKRSKIGKDKRELRYYSPDRKAFYSLITACIWYKNNIGSVSDAVGLVVERRTVDVRDQLKGQLAYIQLSDKILLPKYSAKHCKVKDSGIGKSKKRENVLTGNASHLTEHHEVSSLILDREQKSRSPIQLAKGASSPCTKRILRSSKRIRLGVSPSSPTPRNVLSLLIENNVIFIGEKVHCRGKDGRIIAEGTITCYGIECWCCECIFSISKFVAHAGRNCLRSAENILLENGRSMLDCQLQLMQYKISRSSRIKSLKLKGNGNIRKNDDICSVCHYRGDLVLCDQCPSSFHMDCLDMKRLPEGDWFCPSCCCGICGKSSFDTYTELITDSMGRSCSQCERQYHVGCLQAQGLLHTNTNLVGGWFCNMQCKKIFQGLQQYLGRPVAMGNDGLTWTLAKYIEAEDGNHVGIYNDSSIESYSQLTLALDVMHECFEPVKEPLTNSDIVEDVIFSKRSDLNRLNFHGFYTVLLEKNGELITAATLRVHGKKVAEVPLVATRFQYRRQGMCRILMDQLEKILMQLGVERLVLPATPSVLDTWMTSFGFSKMNKSERLKFLHYTLLDFPGTVMCQKVLK